MKCEQITKIITDIAGLKKTLDLAIEKEIPVKNGLESKRCISEMLDLVLEADANIKLIIAERLFGQDFLGPRAIETVFGPDAVPTEIPPIPFSIEGLKKACASNDQFLILRTDQISPDKLNFPKTKLTLDMAPERRWALVTKDLVPNSKGMNYLEQTEVIIKYLRKQVFSGREMPKEYQEAIAEFESQKEELRTLIISNDRVIWKPTAERLANLQINQLTRRCQEESAYDLELYKQTNNKYLLYSASYEWTNSCSDDYLVIIGRFEHDGVLYNRNRAAYSAGGVGVIFSRTR